MAKQYWQINIKLPVEDYERVSDLNKVYSYPAIFMAGIEAIEKIEKIGIKIHEEPISQL